MNSDAAFSHVLAKARDTKHLEMGEGILERAGTCFQQAFRGSGAVIVADANTYRIAGQAVSRSLDAAGVRQSPPLLMEGNPVAADMANVERVASRLSDTGAVAVAVGSGTLNDLCKLASHKVGRAYLCVATAASMDGYTSYGASITADGIKQTFFCPAPAAVLCDIAIASAAPPPLNASGYADLLAKVACGADWLLADALGVEPVIQEAWDLMQPPLLGWLDDPSGVRAGRPAAVANLMRGLLMAGFSMQVARTSRPASGAEHQFSHLWDMQGHKHAGSSPSHGFKVGIGTIATIRLYEHVLAAGVAGIDPEARARAWPDAGAALCRFRDLHTASHIRAAVEQEYPLKHAGPEVLRERLQRAKAQWPDLSTRLRGQLLPSAEIRERLRLAGAPADANEIGVSAEKLRQTYPAALGIRRRYTVLDFAHESGLLDAFLAAC